MTAEQEQKSWQTPDESYYHRTGRPLLIITQKTSLCWNQTVKETTKKHKSSSNYSSICVTHWTAYSKLSTLTWAKMAAFCPAVTLIACWVAVAGDDVAWPAELELPCFPEPCAGWPTRNVPWENRTRMSKVQL